MTKCQLPDVDQEKARTRQSEAAFDEDVLRLIHDLKNPLTSMRLKIHLADRMIDAQPASSSPQGDLKVRNLLANVDHDIDRMAEILTNFTRRQK